MKEVSHVPLYKLVAKLPKFALKPVDTWADIFEEYGDIFKFGYKKYIVYLVNHPDYVGRILKGNQDNYRRDIHIANLDAFLGKGLFFAEDADWKLQHKVLSPVFHARMMKSFDRFVIDNTRAFIDKWKGNNKIDLEWELKRLLLLIQVQSLFSPEFVFDEEMIIHSLANNKTNPYDTRFRRFFAKRLGYSGSEGNMTYRNAMGNLEKFAADLIAHSKTNVGQNGALMDAMLMAEKEGLIDEKLIRDEIMTFLFAGFDTTAETLYWTFYELAKNKEIQEKIANEARKLDEINSESIGDLPYTELVVKEGLRKYPSAAILHRIAKEEDVLGEYKIPKKAFVVMSPLYLHRHPKFWNKPDAFIPERFNTRIDHPYAYIPFGTGKRVCIGMRMATMQLQIIIPFVLQQAELSLVKDKSKLMPGIIISDKGKSLFSIA